MFFSPRRRRRSTENFSVFNLLFENAACVRVFQAAPLELASGRMRAKQ